MTKQSASPPRGAGHYHIVTHGGIGDLSWVYSKLSNLELPLFVDICCEQPYRPRRSGDFLDTLPKVLGWRYVDKSFATDGRMWVDKDDPAAAFGKTWAELGREPGEPFMIECNKWLESGGKLKDWLPDLPTSYHYSFDDSDMPAPEVEQPAVGLHFTGWPDVSDGVWLEAARALARRAYVYLITSHYDKRSPALLSRLASEGGPNVRPFVGRPWPELWGLLKSVKYLLGHASGMTVLANVLKIPGVVVNPARHPGLINTWNDPDFPQQVQVSRGSEFLSAAFEVADALARVSGSKPKRWDVAQSPLGEILLKSLMSVDPLLSHSSDERQYFYNLGKFRKPRRILYVGDDPAKLHSVLDGAYHDRSARVETVVSASSADPESFRSAAASTCAGLPFKPFIKAASGRPSSREVLEAVKRGAPYDLAVVDLAEASSKSDVYNSMVLADSFMKPGGGLAVVTNLNGHKKHVKHYADFCAAKGKAESTAKAPSGWGLLFY